LAQTGTFSKESTLTLMRKKPKSHSMSDFFSFTDVDEESNAGSSSTAVIKSPVNPGIDPLVAEFCESEFYPQSRGFLVQYAAHVVYIARMARSTRRTAAFLSKKFGRKFSRRPVEDILAKVKSGEIVVTAEQLAQVASEHPKAQHLASLYPDILNPTSKIEIEDTEEEEKKAVAKKAAEEKAAREAAEAAAKKEAAQKRSAGRRAKKSAVAKTAEPSPDAPETPQAATGSAAGAGTVLAGPNPPLPRQPSPFARKPDEAKGPRKIISDEEEDEFTRGLQEAQRRLAENRPPTTG
jgi:chemotaxis protein histidine kinase CheA